MGHQVFTVQLHKHRAGFHVLIHLDGQRLDDPVRLRFDFDFRDRLDFAGRDDRLDHRPQLYGR